MSTPGNTVKIGTVYSSIQVAQSDTSLIGIKPTLHIVSILLSQRLSSLCQPGMMKLNKIMDLKKHIFSESITKPITKLIKINIWLLLYYYCLALLYMDTQLIQILYKL